MAKAVHREMQGFTDSVKVFSMAARAGAIIGNSIFFHTTIITKYEFLVNLLFEQDHGHDHSLDYKTHTNGNDIKSIFKHHCPHKQQYQASPHEQHNI